MSLRRLALSRRDGGEIRDVVASGKGVAFGAKQHHTYARILLGGVQLLGRGPVHGIRQCVLLLRTGKGDFEHRAVTNDLQVIRHANLRRLSLRPQPSLVLRRERVVRLGGR
jgi:hypothetical protein